jgi:hypothetical protein
MNVFGLSETDVNEDSCSLICDSVDDHQFDGFVSCHNILRALNL